MSLVKTLGRVAFGLIVAQASKKLLGGRGGVLGGLLGAVLGGGATRSTAIAGGIGALLTSMLAGKTAQASSSSNSSSGGNILGSLFNMLGGSSPTKNTDMGSVFKAALNDEPVHATAEDEKHAAILLRAMISAVKADGVIDDNEQAKIKEHLKDASQADIDFVTTELRKPLDLQGLIQNVPQGMEKQVYLMSLLAMTLDDPREVKYMQDLSAGLNISVAERNSIHDQLNIGRLA
ncbi:DUF533 domain-containing protein [uncultured Thiothrix sp.]|uniref:DUF533 domain-containing protein n=1 Tax=uncultured Thiothrix sp. TaxID=223185 RepID=UPI00262BE6BA|nr:DUF533 domain-containing protein [uncultured Thiothrix sp.]